MQLTSNKIRLASLAACGLMAVGGMGAAPAEAASEARTSVADTRTSRMVPTDTASEDNARRRCAYVRVKRGNWWVYVQRCW